MGLRWDPISRSMLLCSQQFGGSPVPSPVDTWRWNGRDWAQLSLHSGPLVLDGEVTSTRSGVYLVGALLAGQAAAPPVHIWGWSGSVWAELG